MSDTLESKIRFTRAIAITPSDATILSPVCPYVGGAGVLAVEPWDNQGTTVLLTCIAGEQLSLWCKRILATGTTATLIVGMS